VGPDNAVHGTGSGLGQTARRCKTPGPSLIARVKALRDQRPRLSLREIAVELEREGNVTAKGNRCSASAIRSMLKTG
jgi:hypothetical protein